jgi:hypothetical protein
VKFPVLEKVAGTTFKPTFVSSGATASPISSALLTGSETLSNSLTATSSGDGHYYALHLLPTSPGWLVNQWIAVINANTYVGRQFVKVIAPEVD